MNGNGKNGANGALVINSGTDVVNRAAARIQGKLNACRVTFNVEDLRTPERIERTLRQFTDCLSALAAAVEELRVLVGKPAVAGGPATVNLTGHDSIYILDETPTVVGYNLALSPDYWFMDSQ